MKPREVLECGCALPFFSCHTVRHLIIPHSGPRTPHSPAMASKSSFLDKVLGRIGRLDAQGLQTVVQRLARERNFLETLFNTIEDGVLVVDEHGRILYFNQAVTRLLGIPPAVEE